MYRLLYLLPKNYISAFVGALASIPIPPFMRGFVNGVFAKLAGVCVEDAELPLGAYHTVSGFFTRNLRRGLRPIGDGIVSPVDGKLRASTTVEDLYLEQIKGQRFSLISLVSSDATAAKFVGGTFVSLYLAPPDYHHVHAPLDGEILGITYIPGTLWPVNNWALANISGLFARNERVVIELQTPQGLVALIMVGAMNVGKMTLTFDGLVTNTRGVTRASKRFEPPIQVKKGDRLGTFHLGSTVLLLFDAKISGTIAGIREPGKVLYGESLTALRAPSVS